MHRLDKRYGMLFLFRKINGLQKTVVCQPSAMTNVLLPTCQDKGGTSCYLHHQLSKLTFTKTSSHCCRMVIAQSVCRIGIVSTMCDKWTKTTTEKTKWQPVLMWSLMTANSVWNINLATFTSSLNPTGNIIFLYYSFLTRKINHL